MKKKIAFSSIIVSMITIMIGSLYFLLRSPKAPPRLMGRDRVVPVEMGCPSMGPLRKETSVVGTLRPHQRVVLRSETQGILSKIFVKPGEYVTEGQVLFELNHGRMDAQVRRVEAQVAQAKAQYEKEKHLKDHSAGKGLEYNEALQKLRAADAELDAVKQDLKNAFIVAPFAGQASVHELHIGAFISPQVELLTLVDKSRMWVDFRLPEQHIPALAVGAVVYVNMDQDNTVMHEAVIRAIDPFVDQVTHSAQIRAEFVKTESTMIPGLFARVTVPLHEVPQALMVTEGSLQVENGEFYVMRVVEGRALKTIVTTGIRKEGMVEILDGLSPQDQIIVAGQQRVRDGQKVRVVPSEGASCAS